MNENMTYVPSRLTSAKTNKVVAGANEILDDDINLKQDVINTLSKKVIDLNSVPTSNTLTYTVNSVTCDFKVGDEVRVADQNSDTGYTFYKLYALTTDGGVTTATWDKLGAGGGSANPNETVNISLTQVGGNSDDLTGASITITDDDSGDTLFSATWNGSTINTEIPMGTYYTVSVEAIEGYLPCSDKSYLAGYQTTRNIGFQYITSGIYIEATDGTLYTHSNWDSSKTVNSFVLISSNYKFRIATNGVKKIISDVGTAEGIKGYLTECDSEAKAIADDNGIDNTNKIISYLSSLGVSPSNNNYAAQYCKNFLFPNSVVGYLGSAGEMNVLNSNLSALNQCRNACGLTTIVLGDNDSADNIWTSSLAWTVAGYWRQVHLSSTGLETYHSLANATKTVIPFGTYE